MLGGPGNRNRSPFTSPQSSRSTTAVATALLVRDGVRGDNQPSPFPAARMSTIELEHLHRLPPDAARRAVEDVALRLGQRFGMDYRWEGDTLHFRRAGVDGHIALAPGRLQVRARLGLLLAAMRGPIEQELRRVLAERFG